MIGALLVAQQIMCVCSQDCIVYNTTKNVYTQNKRQVIDPSRNPCCEFHHYKFTVSVIMGLE